MIFFLETVQVHQQCRTDFTTTHGQRIGAHAETRANRIAVSKKCSARKLALYASTTCAGLKFVYEEESIEQDYIVFWFVTERIRKAETERSIL